MSDKEKCEHSVNGICNRYSSAKDLNPCYGDCTTCYYKQLQLEKQRADDAESLYKSALEASANLLIQLGKANEKLEKIKEILSRENIDIEDNYNYMVGNCDALYDINEILSTQEIE